MEINKTKNQPLHVVEAITRENALSKSIIDEKNKGFNLMKKMGFKIGDTLGKQAAADKAIKEPIAVKVKLDREGLGGEEVRKRKKIEIEQKIAKQRTLADEFNKNTFLTNKKKLYEFKKLRKNYFKAQKTCYQLDKTKVGLLKSDFFNDQID